MVKHFPVKDFVFPHEIVKEARGYWWTIKIDINGVKYHIEIDEAVVSYKIVNFKELGLANEYEQILTNSESFRLVYNVGYFIWLYVNELNMTSISYKVADTTPDIIPAMNNRAFGKYFDEPIITKTDNTYLITFKESK